MMIEVKMKWLPEPVLNPQILGIIIERLGMLMTNLSHMATIIHHQMRGVATSGIGATLRLLDGWSRTGERNQLADPKIARTRRRHKVQNHCMVAVAVLSRACCFDKT